MPSFPSWRPKAASEPAPGSAFPATTYIARPRDPNAPDHRLQITSKSIYERALPGGSYITAHCERLQSGYYDSPVIHEDCVANVRFVAIRFVFHEASTERRFKSAVIRLSVRDENLKPDGIPLPPQIQHPADDDPPPPHASRRKPAFMRHAPHLLYGAMSPETLDWNFNLAGSLGVAQTPVTASVNPSGGFKTSYKVYKMMKIQGSIRTNASWYGKHYDCEDGELVWTLEENELQKSGLPREFTFVLMLTKGDEANDVRFDISIEPEVASWFGSYPNWWTHFLKYQPLYKEPLNLDIDIGQKFEPCDSRLGFNFASLMSTFNDFVTLPGTLYSTNDWSSNPSAMKQDSDAAKQKQPGQQGPLTQSPVQMSQGNFVGQDQPTPNNTVHLRIHLDQGPKQGHTLSTDYPYPEPASTPGQPIAPTSSRLRRTPQAAATPSSSTNTKTEGTSSRPPSRGDKLTRRVTLNSGLVSTPPKYKTSRITPLQTHYEEQPTMLRIKSLSDSDETDPDDVPSFPESLPTPPRLPLLTIPSSSSSSHRHSKSLSSAPSAAASAPSNRTAPDSSPSTSIDAAHAPMSSHPSLRRSRSRSGLRRASLHSEPEDEEAIAAAMDMLSGSPPPPAPAPPPPSEPQRSHAPAEKTVLATPRTRSTLADLLEVEEAENARVQRRNGNLNTEMSRQAGDLNPGYRYNSHNVTIRSREREKNREKRYSLPVTSTGIGYPSTDGAFGTRAHDSGIGSSSASGGDRTSDDCKPVSGGRSSLMIPVGPKRDSGLGIGVANSTLDASAHFAGTGNRLLSRRRDIGTAND